MGRKTKPKRLLRRVLESKMSHFVSYAPKFWSVGLQFLKQVVFLFKAHVFLEYGSIFWISFVSVMHRSQDHSEVSIRVAGAIFGPLPSQLKRSAD